MTRGDGDTARVSARWVWSDLATELRPEALHTALGPLDVESWALPRARQGVRLIARDRERLEEAERLVLGLRADPDQGVESGR
jgi:hypothetical protein